MKPVYQRIPIHQLLRHVIRQFRLIIIISLVISGIAAIYAILQDNEYRSTASLLPAQQRSVGIESLIGGRLGSLAGSIVGSGRTAIFDRYQVLLNSETTKRQIVEKFDLITAYEAEGSAYPMLDAIKILDGNTSFRGQLEGNFIIDVWDKSPEKAQAIAEYYVNLLNDFNNDISTKEAREYRIFIETRYLQGKLEIDSLRQELAAFQMEYGVFELNEQVKAYFGLISTVAAEKLQMEMRLELLSRSIGTESAAYQQERAQYNVVVDKLNTLYNSPTTDPLLLNMSTLPDIAKQYFELMQTIEIQAEILQYIVPLYEQAKLEEAKALPLVSIVDHPRVPEKKDRPFRAMIVISAFLSSFVTLVVGFILFLIVSANLPYFRYYYHP